MLKGWMKMKEMQALYHYEILTLDKTDLIHKAASCLAKAFVGTNVSGVWIQEPLVGQLKIGYEDFCLFVKDYLDAVVEQGYCAVAQDIDGEVVGTLIGNTNVPEISGEHLFEGSLEGVNVVMDVFKVIDDRFVADYKNRNNQELKNGELLHLVWVGIIAESDRHEIIKQLGNLLIKKATSQGLKLVMVEATNFKSIRVAEKYYGMEKYQDLDGNQIVYKYEDNDQLSGISPHIGDGVYILTKEL